MSHILPRYYRHQLARIDHENVTRAIQEAGGETTPPDNRKYYSTAGDEARLRGIPAVGRGVQGAINGTRPDQR